MTDRLAIAASIKGLLTEVSAQVDLLAAPDAALAAGPLADGAAPDAPASSLVAIAEDGPHPGFADEGKFYDWLRSNDMLGPTISATEFKGCNAITRHAAAARWPVSYVAYALATAYLETAHQMIPVREAYWLSESAANAYFRRMYDIEGQRPDKARELGNIHPGDGARYCGRGYPQVTGYKNYLKAGTALGVDLVNHPERALEPGIAADIMIHGMSEGWFTGRKLSTYLPASGAASRAQFVPCRSIINGHDREGDVADYAVGFQTACLAGGWRF
ncbi:MAG: hypothetical protein ACJ8DZ_13995 [Allosphingosinicella sp.]